MYVLSFFLFAGLWVFSASAFLGILGSFGVLGSGLMEYFFEVLVKDVSLVCLVMLLCCGSLALFYCFHYFGGGREGYLLFPLMVLFLGVMVILVFTSSLMFTLVLWEYLGLVSFFLILFYSNGASLRASLVTLFASRFGDVSLFMLIMWVSWWQGSAGHWLFLVFVCFMILTKSASYPFISWLLEAMRAPTPVSSLVHSSTLVAAGAWFFFRYGAIFGEPVASVILYLSLVTVLMTGVCATCFYDLKKMVALSTCNNISWCLIFFICGDLGLALLQLLTHGVCKCYLFMSVGDLMGLSGGSQSAVGVFFSRYVGGYGVISQALLIFSLSGVPFLGVFFSKHCLFSVLLYSYGAGLCFLVLGGFLLTYVYSMRFTLLLLGTGGGLSLGYSGSFLMVCGVSLLGSFINFFGSFALCEELVSSSVGGSLGLLFIQVFGCFLGALLYLYNGAGLSSIWESFLWGSDCLVGVVYSLYLSGSEVCMLSFYRWEVYLISVFGVSGTVLGSMGSLFSLKFMISSLCYFFFVLYVLGGLGI